MFSQLKIIMKLWKASIIQSMEYRGSFIFSIFTNFFDFIFGLLQYLVFFTAAKSIAGWSSDNMLALYSVFMFIYSLQFIFLYPNIAVLGEMVNTGGLDLLLTKPLDARLFVLLRKISLEELGSLSTIYCSIYLANFKRGLCYYFSKRITIYNFNFFSPHNCVFYIHNFDCSCNNARKNGGRIRVYLVFIFFLQVSYRHLPCKNEVLIFYFFPDCLYFNSSGTNNFGVRLNRTRYIRIHHFDIKPFDFISNLEENHQKLYIGRKLNHRLPHCTRFFLHIGRQNRVPS